MTCIAIALTCWLCALVASPSKPLPGNEVQELVYARLLGRSQRLVLLACIATLAAVFALLLLVTQYAGADAKGIRRDSVCASSPVGPPTCYRPLPGGTWQEEQLQADGTWRVVRTGLPRPDVTEKDRALDP